MPAVNVDVNNVVLAADNDSFASGAGSFLQDAVEFAGYGIPAAVTSGGVGVYNSLKAVANTFGADLPMTRTSDVLEEVISSDARNYYVEHKVGADVGGFVLTALAAGLGAVKGLQAWQAGGKLSAGMTAATGMRNTDVILGSAQVQAYRASITSNASLYTWRTPQLVQATGLALRQNLAEAAVAEAAVLLTHNQSPLLNPEGLSAWDSSKRAFLEGLPFTLGFAGAATVVDTIRIVGYGRRAFDNEVTRIGTPNAELDTPLAAAISTYNVPGDRMADALQLRRQLDDKVAAGAYVLDNEVQVQRFGNATKQVQRRYDLALSEALGGEQADAALRTAALQFSGKVQEMPNLLDQLSHVGNLQRIERPSLSVHTSMDTFYSGVQGAVLPQGRGAGFTEEALALADLNRQKLRGNAAVWNALQSYAQGPGFKTFVQQVLDYAQQVGDPKLAKVLQDGMVSMQRASVPATELTARRLLTQRGYKVGSVNIDPALADDFVDALSGILARMQHTATGAETVRRFPRLAQIISDLGAAEMPFAPTYGFYNVRTGRMSTSVLPRAHDVGRVADDGIAITLHTADKTVGVNGILSFAADGRKVAPRTVLQRLASGDLEDRTIVLDISAQWAGAANRDLSHWVQPTQRALYKELSASGKARDITYQLQSADDIPAMERLASAMHESDVLVVGTGPTARTFTREQAAEHVLTWKQTARAEYMTAGLSEQHIAVLLGTGEDFALGVKGASDALLMGVARYDMPENLLLQYKAYNAADIELSARSELGLMHRMEHQAAEEAQAAARVLPEEDSALLPAENLQHVATLRQTDWTAGMLNSAEATFGTFREWAQNVGALMHRMKDDSRQAINNLFLPHYQRLSQTGAYAQRAQLALAVNAARTHDYMLFKVRGLEDTPDQVTHYMLKAEVFRAHVDDAVRAGKTEQEALEALELPNTAHGFAGAKNGDAMLLHRDVGGLLEMHMERNREYAAHDKVLANAKHRYITRNPEILYPPPLNLRRTPHFVFVRPRDNVEAPSYMLYGATAQELAEKIAYTEKNYGGKFAVVDTKDVELYKRLRGEYEEGRVFNEWDFDQNLQRMGKAGNFQPSLDVSAAETLDLMRNWHHSKREMQLMEAVEVKYSATMQALRAASEVYGASNTAARLGQATGKRDIFEDTRRLMLDTATYDGTLARTYRTVQAEIGNVLSKGLDTIGYSLAAVWGKVRRGESGFSTEDFDVLNDTLARTGFENPYKEVGALLTRSEVISDGRTLGQLTRVLNTFVATTTLRADFLNSFLQAVSGPILGSGVIREAKRALAGTAQGARLQAMTTVVNPASGLREPTTIKLFAKATHAYFTDSGAVFAEELRKRGILTDYTRQFLDASDFSSLNGRHTLQDLQQKLDNLGEFVGKYSGHQKAEDFSRFLVAHALKEVGELRGMQGEELYAMIRNGVDKANGIHRKHQRAQLFNGVIGQSMGLFQTYMFNFAQRMLRHLDDGAGKEVAMAAMLQASYFGVRSLPGFGMLNQWVASTNSGNVDIYTLAGTDADPTGFGSYLLYGLGANATIVPTDLYGRGDIALRHATVVPVNPLDWPALSMLAKTLGTVADSARMFTNGEADGATAVAYGLAHNGLWRPLQGIGTAWLGAVTTNSGTPLFTNANYKDYRNNGQLSAFWANPGWDTGADLAKALHWGALGARILGGKPRDEGIMLDSYYRRTAYQTAQREKLARLGEQVRVQMLSGAPLQDATYADFASKYEEAGGLPENFHQYFSTQLAAASHSSVEEFQQKLSGDNAFSRTYNRMREERTETQPWVLDAQ